VVCVQDEKDPVVSYIEDIVRKYPHIDSRVFKGNFVCTCLFGLVKLLVLPNPIIPYYGLFCIHSFFDPSDLLHRSHYTSYATHSVEKSAKSKWIKLPANGKLALEWHFFI